MNRGAEWRQVVVQEGDKPTWQGYLLKPALGFVVAIAVFTLFKVGQLVISNNTTTLSGESLNPFLVAFIGVISGLVAKQAIARIEAAGASIFMARDERQPIFGRDLLAKQLSALTPADVTMLISMLATNEEELKSWQTEKTPILRRACEILSAFLRTEGRDLFATEPRTQ